jgi:hypothetical protein
MGGGAGNISFSWITPKKKQHTVQLRVTTPFLNGETDKGDNKDSIQTRVG